MSFSCGYETMRGSAARLRDEYGRAILEQLERGPKTARQIIDGAIRKHWKSKRLSAQGNIEGYDMIRFRLRERIEEQVEARMIDRTLNNGKIGSVYRVMK